MKNIILFLFTITFFMSCNNQNKETTVSSKLSNDPAFADIKDRAWWKEAVVYQIYPRSFKDNDGDGVGDLKGIISKLDYLKSLGVDIIWLNPIYGSPNADNGYDISDYKSIMKEFGTMDDFNTLLKGMHNRGIKLVMDLVVNHCSDEHEWFKQSRSSRANPYRDYFHWWLAERGKPAFRPGSFEVDGSGWRFDSLTNAYYLHYFSYKQPDLNWENPKVRQEIFSMMRSWFDKGVDGFRMDVIPVIAKDTTFPVITQKELDEKYGGGWFTYFASTPAVHTYLQEMNKEVLSKYDVMTLAEGAGTTKATAMNFVDPDRKELDMSYHFEGVDLGYIKGKYKTTDPNRSLLDFKKVYSDWDSVFANKGWGTIYLGNHDQPRMVSRWGNDAPQFREASSKMLTTFLLTMRGTPYYYNGDELGMDNIRFDSIQDYNDVDTRNRYLGLQKSGGDLKAFLEDKKQTSRDNGRTPFQWDATANAGFTTGSPWLKINKDYTTLNAAAQDKDANSCLNYFRKLTKLRKENPTMVYGKYILLDKDNPDVYAYTREMNGETFFILLNFTKKTVDFNFNEFKSINKSLVISNYNNSDKVAPPIVKLQPYQAIIYKAVK